MAAHSGTREAWFGYYWIAKARLETGELASATQILEAILGADFPAHERFGQVDFGAAVRQLAARAYIKAGDPTKAEAVLAGN